MKLPSPETLAGWLPRSLVAAGLAALAIIGIHAAFQQRTDVSQGAFTITLGLIIPALVLTRVPGPPHFTSTRVDRGGLTAWMLSLNAALLLLVVPAFLAVWQTDVDHITGWRGYPLFNKRWLMALYAIAIGSLVVLPVVIARVVNARVSIAVPAVPARPWWRRAAMSVPECALLLVVVWYLAGPPWHVATHHRPIDFHEQVHLGPLQAIDKGAMPYIGPASTQYGPGFQYVVYRVMKGTDQFNLVGFRESFLTIHLAVFAIVAILGRIYMGPGATWLVLIVGVLCSPLKFFLFGPEGTPGESFGWGNAARYLGTIVVIPALAVLLTRPIALAPIVATIIGIAWGALAWGSQESLLSVVSGGGLLVVLLIATSSTDWRKAGTVVAGLAAGFLVFWIPLVLIYAANGDAWNFLGNYWLLPSAVAAGYQNTWWQASPDSMGNAFYFTPVLMMAFAFLTMWEPWTLRARTPLDRDQVRFLSFLCALAACYQSALLRSDSLHLLNTFIALPFVLVLAVRDVPGWSASTWMGRAAVRIALTIAILVVYPLATPFGSFYDSVLVPPRSKYVERTAEATVAEAGVAFDRATIGLQDEPTVVGPGTGSMRDFLRDASALHRLVGERRTLVQAAEPYFTGLVYFMADLTPAPYLYDAETMILNDRVQARALDHLRQHIDEVDCVIVKAVDVPEAQMFLAAHANAVVTPVQLGAAHLIVLSR